MSKALKYAVIISGAIVLLDLIMDALDNALNLTTVCMLSGGFIALTIFLFIAFEIGGIFLRGGKKALRWLNDEPEPKNKKTYSQYDEIEGMILYENEKDHRTYFWNDLSIILGTAEYFIKNAMNIPYDGILIVKDKDFTLFKRVDDLNISEREIKSAVKDCIEHGDCDLIMAWKGNQEVSCAKGHYFFYAYSVDYAGLMFNDVGFLHLFDSDCKEFVKSKAKLFEFVKKNVNKNEVALILSLPAYTILSLSEKVARRSMGISQSIFIVMFPEEKISYFYNIPFKIRSKKELIKIANEAQRLQAEIGVVLEFNGKMIIAAKADFARLFIPSSKESDLKEDIISIQYNEDEPPIVAPVKWRAWSREKLIKVASEVVGPL